MECWENNGCDTGTGGDLKVGFADGFGGNIARQTFKMEFILQALTYPEIGEIGYTDANLDTQKAISDVRSFAAQGYDVILSFPDAGEALVPAYRAATEQGSPCHLVGGQRRRAGNRLPHVQRQRHLRPRQRLGHAAGRGAPRRRPDRDDHRRPRQPDRPGPRGVPARDPARQHRGGRQARPGVEPRGYLEAMSAILAEYPDLDGVVASYADAFVGGMRAYDAAGIPMDGLVTMHQSDDNSFLCGWKDAGGVTDSYTYVALLVEGRTGLTAAMMKIAGYDVPPEIIFGGRLKPVTEDSCRTDIPPDGSPSSLVPADLQNRMFPAVVHSTDEMWCRRLPAPAPHPHSHPPQPPNEPPRSLTR